jgi:hypothetical protein
MELFTSLRDARVVIENYRLYFFEERLYGTLGYVPSREFKEQWLAAHPDFCMGALPPHRPPGFIAVCIKAEERGGEPDCLGMQPGSAPMAGHRYEKCRES